MSTHAPTAPAEAGPLAAPSSPAARPARAVRGAPAPGADLDAAIAAACRRIAPLWPLRNFVAVNPYLGWTGRPFHEAVGDVARIFHARSFLPLEAYRQRHRRGRIRDDDLELACREAARRLGRPVRGAETPAALCGASPRDEAAGDAPTVETFSEALDREAGTDLADVVVDEMAKWCAARFDRGQAGWPMPWADAPVFPAWREAASIDRSPELRGLRGFRRYVRRLPDAPRDAIAAVLGQLGVPPARWEAFLARSLATVAGWAGHVQHRVREAALRGEEDDALVHLLAVRVAYEGGVHHAAGRRAWPSGAPAGDGPGCAGEAGAPPERAFVWQLALEAAYRRELAAALARGAGSAAPDAARPALQAVFCIDVRSEVLRRHLEARSPRIRTLGFAGFFGFPFASLRPGEAEGSARCPALIAPSHRVRLRAGQPDAEARLRREEERHRTFKAMRLSTVSAFPFVETVGALFGPRLLADALTVTRVHDDGRLFASRAAGELAPDLAPQGEGGGAEGLTHEDRVDLAEGALRNLGLTDGFAETVLLCGHGSETTNNPYASALDCGACGGHPGDLNARVAAAVLEDPQVRRALAGRGIRIPHDTRFVAGLHETTTDTVTLLDADRLAPGVRDRLEGWLAEAARRARAERETRLRRTPASSPDRAARRRSRDWAEVRPEWGLARNAAFVAAPRARTRGLDLDGRVFLHDYDAARDPDGAILELVLSAPLVVASWINLQYYASTVDPDVFGSGDKVLHNVVGRHGVMLGNRSDLRPGLPLQSVHDGVDHVHEPLRLLAVVEAPRAHIARALEAQPAVRELVGNDWIQLLALEPGGRALHRWVDGRFELLEDSPGPA